MRTPCDTASASRSAVSISAERRTGAASATPSASKPGSGGGSHSANVTPARGDPSSVTASTGRPVSRPAVVAGSPAVAEARMNVGADPYRAQMRRSRSSTCATCEPNTPRYA